MAKSSRKTGGKGAKVKNLPRSKNKIGDKEMKRVKGGVIADGKVRFISPALLPYSENHRW